VCADPACSAPSLLPVPAWQGSLLLPGGTTGRYVNGEVKLRREHVIRERDGSETVYVSKEQMRRKELERTNGNEALARKNLQTLSQSGLIPGTDRAKYAAAVEEKFA